MRKHASFEIKANSYMRKIAHVSMRKRIFFTYIWETTVQYTFSTVVRTHTTVLRYSSKQVLVRTGHTVHHIQ